ncbi:MAG: hypothetical protein JWO42_1002 [Chloroflexi bacterium]|nr:hypothetical protein [Chloroflexota bacterium]
MTNKASIDNHTGTPQPRHIFAVFDSVDGCKDAVQELNTIGIQAEKLQADDASSLQRPADNAGVLGKFGRFLKGMGGETNMAMRYAQHLQDGHVMLAAPVSDNETAQKVTGIVTGHGGYEVTYFRDWSIQYMSPNENIDRGVPTHSTTNTDKPGT